MNRSFILAGFISLLISCVPAERPEDDMLALALERKTDLQLGVYITAHAVDQLLSGEAGRREALSLLQANGITKVFVEVYRSGLTIPAERMRTVVTFFREHGFEVVGGIATVPGNDVGVRQEARYTWFNWQAEKTQNDLKKVLLEAAPLFDSFIVDDFLCTADTSRLSKAAKEDRSWSVYRRDLLVDLSRTIFIEVPKKVNPDIHMIIKYPQWYDRYHLFGYDVPRQNALFDEVWIGTETRGQYTQRFGFVQPYEGFVNYRWMASLSGDKMGGAWFDHIDCDDHDFIDQAFQSVLGGANELTLFNYFNFVEGHPGQHLLRMEFENLADLARQVSVSPVSGISAYKPPNSESGSDLYLMDFLGMMGIPVLPVSAFPVGEKVIFLPTQAASDSIIYDRLVVSLQEGARIIVTAGFLSHAKNGEEIARMAGIQWPLTIYPQNIDEIIVRDKLEDLHTGLMIEADLRTLDASALLEVISGEKRIPYFTRNKEGNLFVLNVHTFSQEDFDAVGEVLLCPRPLGLMEIPESWANTLRWSFNELIGIRMEAPARVSCQPFGENEMMIQNYNTKPVSVRMEVEDSFDYYDVLSGLPLIRDGSVLNLIMPARSRLWIRQKSSGEG